MHTSPPAMVALGALAVLALMWWGGRNSSRGIITRKFGTTFDPGGPYTECKVQFVLDDLPAPCVVRTTGEGWYMVTPESARRRWNWANNVAFLRQPVFIPWTALEYSPAKFPMSSWVRFDVTGTKATFFVPRNVALPLLQAGGMPPPV